ncbi:hypothetical protein J437_LFUL002362 [Ladona fulva]|uniref:Uncharacterized protein n=1 Tax=Ladona fulva TaxID=123851 RepID=A0A8K0K7R2_LADFU|nr:hypothetical protein J437_LFUL002362 [Ladona fulva]
MAVLYANDVGDGADDGEDEDETNSMASGSIISQTDSQVSGMIRRGCLNQSPYQTLVDKYEALLQVQRKQALSHVGNRHPNLVNSHLTPQNGGDSHPLSLQEELQMSGDFSGPQSLLLPEEDDLEEDFEVDDVDQERPRTGIDNSNENAKVNQSAKEEPKAVTHSGVVTSTPNTSTITNANSSNHTSNQDSLFFSEAETASSGFSDDPVRCVHRSTQTDECLLPHHHPSPKSSEGTNTDVEKSNKKDADSMSRRGTLLCSITEGEDCYVSIYDEALPPTKSRFVKNHPTREVGSGKPSDANGIVGDKQSVGESPENRRQMFREIFAVLKRTLMEARESSHLDEVVDVTQKTAPAEVSEPPSTEAKVTPAEENTKGAQEELKEDGIKLTPYRKASRDDMERVGSGRKGKRGEGRRRGGSNHADKADKTDAKQEEEAKPSLPAEPSESSMSADESQSQTSVKRRHHRRGRNAGKALLVAAVTGNHQRSQGEGNERCSWPLGGPSTAPSPSAEMARLMRLERSYADALRLGAPRKETPHVWGRGGSNYRGGK